MLVAISGHVLLPPVGDLQKEHAVVIDDAEEDDGDYQMQQVLCGGAGSFCCQILSWRR